jgi:hypothetical protein
MAKSSVISHPTEDYFSRCFTWQVALCEGNICAAHILNYMEYSTNSFLDTIEKSDRAFKRKEVTYTNKEDKRIIEKDNDGMPIIPISYDELTRELIYQFGRNQVIDAVHYLIEEDLLKPIDNSRNSTDKINYYSLNVNLIKGFIEFWDILIPFRKGIMDAVIKFKNNKRKGDTTVYYQTIHSLILNHPQFNIKLSTVYYQTIDGLILNDVYNVLRLIKTTIKTYKEYKKGKKPDEVDDGNLHNTDNENPLPLEAENKEKEKSCAKKENKYSHVPLSNEVFKNADNAKEFFDIWGIWIKYKKEDKKDMFKSETSEVIGIKTLLRLSDNNCKNALMIVENSIANGYKGLFELKESNKPKAQQETKVNISDRSRYNVADAMDF